MIPTLAPARLGITPSSLSTSPATNTAPPPPPYLQPPPPPPSPPSFEGGRGGGGGGGGSCRGSRQAGWCDPQPRGSEVGDHTIQPVDCPGNHPPPPPPPPPKNPSHLEGIRLKNVGQLNVHGLLGVGVPPQKDTLQVKIPKIPQCCGTTCRTWLPCNRRH